MPEITQKACDEVLEVLRKYGIDGHLEPKGDGTYKPLEPVEEHWTVDGTGLVEERTSLCSSARTEFFNRFRNEKTARRAAATDRINHLYFQWCEAHNHDPSKDKSPFKNVDFSQSGEWVIESWSSFVPQFHFKNIEMASQFLKECRPYLDEYAKEMGWLDA